MKIEVGTKIFLTTETYLTVKKINAKGNKFTAGNGAGCTMQGEFKNYKYSPALEGWIAKGQSERDIEIGKILRRTKE